MGKTYRTVRGKKVKESKGANQRAFGDRYMRQRNSKCKCDYCKSGMLHKHVKKNQH